ncbi:hypothetical protein GF362_06600 [Candidatus Dojkabacteria bacterium]|nr:hypothetical protein [Candidatus Dojkabacteria bacterium]
MDDDGWAYDAEDAQFEKDYNEYINDEDDEGYNDYVDDYVKNGESIRIDD